MTRYGDQDIERLFEADHDVEPPADLAARIKAEIPADLAAEIGAGSPELPADGPPAGEEAPVLSFPRRLLRQRALASAAAMIVAVGMAWVGMRWVKPQEGFDAQSPASAPESTASSDESDVVAVTVVPPENPSDLVPPEDPSDLVALGYLGEPRAETPEEVQIQEEEREERLRRSQGRVARRAAEKVIAPPAEKKSEVLEEPQPTMDDRVADDQPTARRIESEPLAQDVSPPPPPLVVEQTEDLDALRPAAPASAEAPAPAEVPTPAPTLRREEGAATARGDAAAAGEQERQLGDRDEAEVGLELQSSLQESAALKDAVHRKPTVVSETAFGLTLDQVEPRTVTGLWASGQPWDGLREDFGRGNLPLLTDLRVKQLLEAFEVARAVEKNLGGKAGGRASESRSAGESESRAARRARHARSPEQAATGPDDLVEELLRLLSARPRPEAGAFSSVERRLAAAAAETGDQDLLEMARLAALAAGLRSTEAEPP